MYEICRFFSVAKMCKILLLNINYWLDIRILNSYNLTERKYLPYEKH